MLPHCYIRRRMVIVLNDTYTWAVKTLREKISTHTAAYSSPPTSPPHPPPLSKQSSKKHHARTYTPLISYYYCFFSSTLSATVVKNSFSVGYFFFFFLPRCIYDAYIIMYHHSIVQSHIIQLAAPPLLRDRPRGLSIGRWRHTRSMSNGAVADGINVLSHCIRAHD